MNFKLIKLHIIAIHEDLHRLTYYCHLGNYQKFMGEKIQQTKPLREQGVLKVGALKAVGERISEKVSSLSELSHLS